MKRDKPTPKDDSPIKRSAALSAVRKMVPYMNFYTEQISGDDMMKLWRGLQDAVKAADNGTISGMVASGITFKGGLRGDVTVSITPNGFVLIFTSAKPEKASTTR